MGLFNFFKKKEQPVEKPAYKSLLAMPMFNNGETFDLDKLVEHLKTHWNLKVYDIERGDRASSLTIDEEVVAFATISHQIPWDDIKVTAPYAYNWKTAENDLQNHNSHMIVTIIHSEKSPLDSFRIFTKVLSSLLATSNSIGVYQGNQTLLIPKKQYIESAEVLKENKTPFDLWLYIGLRKTEKGNNVYTYGLTFFDKLEIEVVDSKLDLQEIYLYISNICCYIIGSNVTFKNGETLGYTDEQKIKIRQSKGQFVDGQTLRLEM